MMLVVVTREYSCPVMAGLVPAIHVFTAAAKKGVDARPKAGHNGNCGKDNFQ
jgi:hypothetical protein